VNDFVFLFLTIVLFLLPHMYKALLAESVESAVLGGRSLWG